MWFSSIGATNLRCFETLQYQPGRGVNLIWGANGSGKTSLLEAVSMVALGRSFLTARSLDLVKRGAAGLSVRGEVFDDSGHRSVVVVRKDRKETRITLDGLPVGAASVLAQRIPTLSFDSRAADLLTEAPSNRRALLDRTMFHVEPGYIEAWKRYRVALRQRNSLLRQRRPGPEAAFWNGELAASADRIDIERRRLVEWINDALASGPLPTTIGQVQFDYQPGWSRAHGLPEQLHDSWARDAEVGHTSLGAHRADLALKVEGRGAAKRLSRGQGKIVVSNLFAALAHFIEDRTARAPVMLVDDLAAELDDKMRSLAVEMIAGAGGQHLYTAIKAGDLPEIEASAENVFHVEQMAPGHQ